MKRYVVLLRGINLGSKRRVPMAELRAALEAAGYENVRTLLQSGNVVLDAGAGARRLEPELAAVLRKAFGIDIGVVVRTPDQLAKAIAGDPFSGAVDNPSLYQVSFLGKRPAAGAIEKLRSAVVPPEQLAIVGRTIYAHHPKGVARSKLALAISARNLGTEVTARNWRTLTKLLEMARRS